MKTPAAARRTWKLFAALTLAACVLAEVAFRGGALAGLDTLYSDLWHRLHGQRAVPQHVALVVIDEASLNQYPDDPLVFWPPLFARAIGTLRQVEARTIGVDFLFSSTPEGWFAKLDLPANAALQKYDLAFRQALNSGSVTLVGAIGHGSGGAPDSLLLPHADYLLALPDMDLQRYIGLADLVTDEDGVIRRFRVVPRLNLPKEQAQGAPRLSLGGMLAVRATGQDPAAEAWTFGARRWTATDEQPIAFAGPNGTIPRVPFWKLLEKDAASDPAVAALRGKVVIIGADYLGMNDIHPTPYSGSLAGRAGTLVAGMAGPEIQANIVETLLAGRTLAAVPAVPRTAVLLTVLALSVWVFLRLRPLAGLGVFVAGAAAALLLGYLAFGGDVLWSAAQLQLGLAAAFLMVIGSRLTREERDKARIRHLFEGYVSDDVVDMLLAGDAQIDLGGQSMHITVLFSDVRNFTTITEKLTAHETIEFLNVYFERVIDVIRAEGGRIDKFIGDAVMAEFGVPYPFPDHAARALRAAVAMRAVADDFRGWMQQRFAGRDLPDFAVGIGIHTGTAVVGNLGSAKRMEYTAIGDTVNVASRLEGETKAMGCAIVASAATVAAAGDLVVTGRHDTLKVKGRAEPVPVYEIIDIRKEAA